MVVVLVVAAAGLSHKAPRAGEVFTPSTYNQPFRTIPHGFSTLTSTLEIASDIADERNEWKTN